MPMRPPSGQAGRIHRSLEWGDLAGIVTMDTRWYGREQQLDYGAALAAVADQGPAAQMAAIAALQTQVQAQDRTLLGAEQEAWLTGELERFQGARKTWTVLAQQLVFGRQLAPAGIANLLPPDTAPYARRFAELGGMLGVAGLEFNLDAWGGYPAARERLVQTVLRNANNAVILGGDSHNCWVNNVPGGPNGLAAMLEIAGTSVTSPGFESYLSNAAPGQREEMLRAPNEAMVYCNVTDKGYAALTLQRDSAAADLVFFSVPGVRSPQAPEPTRVRLEAEAVRGPGVGGWSVRG
jgi:alkaline phosphatase D